MSSNISVESPNNLEISKKMKKEFKDAKKKEKDEKFAKKQQMGGFKKSDEKIVAKNVVIEKIKYNEPTKDGEKKNITCDLPDKFSSSYVEAAWYSWWEKMGFFSPDYKKKGKIQSDGQFVILIPPPNVTGTLHLGHALTCSIQDCLARWHRMSGREVLWNPGCDHAGIATQVVVEKKLRRERGLSRHDLGREKFLDEVWDWKKEKGDNIFKQMKVLGISVDWSRQFFTMDEPRSKGVVESFIRLHEKGLIYRAKRLVNWSCTLNSAISDIEVDKVELMGRKNLHVPGYSNLIEFGVLIEFNYKIENSDRVISVATTRLETMLGDTGIAVNPNDERYKDLVGKFALHPFCERKLAIVTDNAVDMSFGTGAVKVTPAHDHTDYEIGLRHGLEAIQIIDKEGKISNIKDIKKEYSSFIGIKRFDARYEILKAIKTLKIYVKTIENPMTVPICSRSKDIIEPMLVPQWYVSCRKMANEAIEVVRSGELKIIPKQHEKTWYNWMENIQDWCISRQLWWGHRIPAYLVTSNDPNLISSSLDDGTYWISARSKEEALVKASIKFGLSSNNIMVTQDEDVLDTWFSSGLLPFTVFGWPEEGVNLDRFYPNSLLETGYDILFFWVARMVMLSMELTGKLPFKEVLLHPLIRDSHGRKMSKSLGNIIDPVQVIEGATLEELQTSLKGYNLDAKEYEKAIKSQKQDFPSGIPECGADALRFSLCAYMGQSRDINLDVLRIQGYRFFCNKIWNATRFVLMNLPDDFVYLGITDPSHLDPMDWWILSRLSFAVKTTGESFSSYDFTGATSAIYNFWLYDLCDVYIEHAKNVFVGSHGGSKLSTLLSLVFCIDNALRLLSPFMPFLTEELYQRLPFPNSQKDDHFSITTASYPSDLPYRNLEVENQFSMVYSTIKGIRVTKDDYLPSKTKTNVYIHCYSDSTYDCLARYLSVIQTLSFSQSVEITKDPSDIPSGCAVYINGNLCAAHVLLKGMIDFGKEADRISKVVEKSHTTLSKLLQTMSLEEYMVNAPQQVREQNNQKVLKLKEEIEKYEKVISTLRSN